MLVTVWPLNTQQITGRCLHNHCVLFPRFRQLLQISLVITFNNKNITVHSNSRSNLFHSDATFRWKTHCTELRTRLIFDEFESVVTIETSIVFSPTKFLDSLQLHLDSKKTTFSMYDSINRFCAWDILKNRFSSYIFVSLVQCSC